MRASTMGSVGGEDSGANRKRVAAMETRRRSDGERRTLREAMRRVPIKMSRTVERFFYQLGHRIALHPGQWLAGSTVVVLLCLAGLLRFRQERNPLKLWVPPDSDFARDTTWLMTHFGEGVRVQSVILTGDNVLEPRALLKLNEVVKRVEAAQTLTANWTDVCFKVPVISLEKRERRSSDDDFFEEEPGAMRNRTPAIDPGVFLPRSFYCNIVNNLPKACLLLSILDIWEYDSDIIIKKTKEDVLKEFNSASVSPTLGHAMNYSQLLGGVTRDGEGRIVGATAVKTQWMVHVNFSEVDMDKTGNDVGTAEWGTEDALAWESVFMDVAEQSSLELREQQNAGDNLALWYEAARSYGDISSSTMFQDMDKLITGIILMSVYVQVILSKFNWVEWRFCLTTAGLFCVGGAFIIAVGVCSLFGVTYGPVHTSLPFMLMGLGVDDIFVMMASWEQVLSHEPNRGRPLPERVAMMLSHAGASISLTSLTDVVAFVIGASTILPSLQSFCIYAAVGVFVTFLLQVTFFVGFFTLDMRRSEARRNGIFPCIVHRDYEPAPSEKRASWQFVEHVYSRMILTRWGKIAILSITLGIAAVGVLGSCQLEQWFDPEWFLPKETYLARYLQVRNEKYPMQGHEAAVYMGNLDYPANFPKMLSLAKNLTNEKVLQAVEPWPVYFAEYLANNYNQDLTTEVLNEEEFNMFLSQFLFSRAGGKFQKNFRFAGKLICGENAPRILVASLDFSFRAFSGPKEWIPAMDRVKEIVANAGIDGFATVWSKVFGNWVTDKVIAQEVSRNLILALVCVMGTTALLIAEPQTCFWILLCVLLTLLDVCGLMFYWGLTVDIVSCIGLELAVGLSVDYAAHVAHAFLNAETHDGPGDRKTRALNAVKHIGAAVTYGAGSTLLALSLLAGSQAYVFRAFFKIFFLVIVFGLWHGLMLLPVVLSTVGPRGLREKQTASTGRAEDVELAAPLKEETQH